MCYNLFVLKEILESKQRFLYLCDEFLTHSIMKKSIVFLVFLFVFSFITFANEREIVLGQGNYGNGHGLVYVEPPVVTYDDELNELTVFFGSDSTIDIECDDGTGTPYYYVYGESHYGYTSTTYYNLPSGYYTITIHGEFGMTYIGNFTIV